VLRAIHRACELKAVDDARAEAAGTPPQPLLRVLHRALQAEHGVAAIARQKVDGLRDACRRDDSHPLVQAFQQMVGWAEGSEAWPQIKVHAFLLLRNFVASDDHRLQELASPRNPRARRVTTARATRWMDRADPHR